MELAYRLNFRRSDNLLNFFIKNICCNEDAKIKIDIKSILPAHERISTKRTGVFVYQDN